MLQKIANSADLRYDLTLDSYNDTVSRAILDAMNAIQKDASLKPLEKFSRTAPTGTHMPLDRYVFLMGTMRAAKNNAYNINPSMDDPLRGPYYNGEKNIYDLDDVDSDFKIGFPTDYIIVFVACAALIFNLMTILLNCIARIFNMLFLYLIAPPIFAAQSFDHGGKTKQWLTAFIVQSFSVFGTVISMHLLLIVLPIITSSSLVLFENGLLNVMAKFVMVYGVFEVVKKSTGLLTGILADSAGWQSIQAGDMSTTASRVVGGAAGLAGSVAGTALRAGGKTASFVAKPVTNLAKRPFTAAADRWTKLGSGNAQREAAKSLKRERLIGEMRGTGGNAQPERSALAQGSELVQSSLSALAQKTGADTGKTLPAKAPAAAQAPGGGDKAPLSPAAKALGGEGKAPLSPAAQSLFGVDADGSIPSKASNAPKRDGGTGKQSAVQPEKPDGSSIGRRRDGVDSGVSAGGSMTADAIGSRPVLSGNPSAERSGASEAPALSARPVLTPPPPPRPRSHDAHGLPDNQRK